jgi:hypothetical protein
MLDILTAGYNQDLQFGNPRLGTHGWNGSYSVPWGDWTGTLYGYTNTYYQQLTLSPDCPLSVRVARCKLATDAVSSPGCFSRPTTE